MRILCDEHVPPPVVNALRGEGIEVATVTDELEPGTADTDVLSHATDRGYLLLTNDSDFVDRPEGGVLYYDDQSTTRRDLVNAVRTVEDLLADTDLTEQTIYLPDGWV
ncbi:hypothetical protein BRC64_00610 [Halobacteriales archaeon QH_10_67_22]|nr:MAG: hypothetical protein BRC64_00610 [Halobacteriales archaeon QH_10_67_22]